MAATDEYLVELDRILSEPLAVCASVRIRPLTTCWRMRQPSVLFGAGNLGRKVLQCLRSIGVEPLAFADNSPSKWGSQVDGVPVLSPKDAAAQYGGSALFLIAIWSLGTITATAERSSKAWDVPTSTPPHSCAGSSPTNCYRLLPGSAHKLYEQAADVRKRIPVG